MSEIEPPASTPETPEIPLPDGIGLSLEQARALVGKVHGEMLPKNDAILMVGTILNAWLSEIQKLQTRHESGLNRLMAEKTDTYVSGVQTAVSQLSTSLSSASVEGIRKVFDDHAARLNAFKNSTAWLAAIVAVSALVNVAVFVLKAVR
ncbi:hypothetical protein [Desulfovibrio desulfuricans]|uniref:hypothetical protein n=1 Tax=Desulfovibrio desulfuricans TaxID=876 RepID=UPI0003B2EA15|nr:hypothetical protein [Desulfovibrio desulfuricans]